MIKIYTPADLECVAVIIKAISIEWNLRFYDYGSFVINLPFDCPHLQYWVKNNYVFHNGNVGIILYREQKKDSIEVRGYDLKGITSFRTCQGTKTGNVETVIKSYATEELTVGSKAIPNLTIAADQNRGESITKTVDLAKLDKTLNEICLENSMGYNIKKVDSGLVFDVVVPTDRSASVIFSRRFKNISDFDYIQDDYDSVNTVYNLDGTITEYYNEVKTGLNRRETFTKNTDDAEAKALQEITGTKESVSAEANHRNKYNVSWFLGDYVQVVIEAFGETLSVKKQITEVKEVYEQGKTSIVPTFGEKKESAIKRLLKGVK